MGSATSARRAAANRPAAPAKQRATTPPSDDPEPDDREDSIAYAPRAPTRRAPQVDANSAGPLEEQLEEAFEAWKEDNFNPEACPQIMPGAAYRPPKGHEFATLPKASAESFWADFEIGRNVLGTGAMGYVVPLASRDDLKERDAGDAQQRVDSVAVREEYKYAGKLFKKVRGVAEGQSAAVSNQVKWMFGAGASRAEPKSPAGMKLRVLDIRRELQAMRFFTVDGHENINPLVQVYESPDTLLIVSPRGWWPLDKLMDDKTFTPTIGDVQSIMRGILSGLSHMHKFHWAHLDLKPANCVVDEQGTVKLIDLGLATQLKEEDEKTGLMTSHELKRPMGTWQYMAPETIMAGQDRHHKITPKADVWSAGCIMFELLVVHQHANPLWQRKEHKRAWQARQPPERRLMHFHYWEEVKTWTDERKSRVGWYPGEERRTVAIPREAGLTLEALLNRKFIERVSSERALGMVFFKVAPPADEKEAEEAADRVYRGAQAAQITNPGWLRARLRQTCEAEVAAARTFTGRMKDMKKKLFVKAGYDDDSRRRRGGEYSEGDRWSSSAEDDSGSEEGRTYRGRRGRRDRRRRRHSRPARRYRERHGRGRHGRRRMPAKARRHYGPDAETLVLVLSDDHPVMIEHEELVREHERLRLKLQHVVHGMATLIDMIDA